MIRKEGLTEIQLKALEEIIDYINEHHHSPYISEISDRLDRSTPTVIKHLDRLEEKGYIRRKDNEVRGIEVLSTPPSSEYVLVKKEVLEQALKVIRGEVTDDDSVTIAQSNLESKLKKPL